MRRVLVTGGTGFVGANLVRRLLALGHEVHLSVRHGYNPWRLRDVAKDVRWRLADLGDEPSLRRIVGAIRPDWIFHLAAHGAYPHQTGLRAILETNLTATVNLVEACIAAGFEALVNTGSSSEYGFKDHPPAETEWLEPNSYYAVTKSSATLFCRHAAQRHRAHIPTLRLYSLFGPFEEPTRLIPSLIAAAMSGELPPLANPDTARDYVYVEDAVDAYLLAASCPGQEPGAVYNVGTGVQTSLRQVVEVARSVMRISAEPMWGSFPGRSWDTNTWVADTRLIRERLAWRPAHSFQDGFAKTVSWFRQCPEPAVYFPRRSTAAHEPAGGGSSGRPSETASWSRSIRRIILQQSKRAHVGHIGSALSIADLVAALYQHVLRIPAPGHPGRDRFILSKGHAALALYAALFLKGWISEERLNTYCADGSTLGVHPERVVEGIDFSTGSLAQGVSYGAGAALAARLEKSLRRVFVLVSDAECNEGSLWEAVMFAAHHRLSNLIVIVDLNGQQALGYTSEVLNLSPMNQRWSAFAWDVHEVDGHNGEEVVRVISALDTSAGPPHAIIARTVSGKGVSFMEGQIKWHYWPMSDQEFAQAMTEVQSRHESILHPDAD